MQRPAERACLLLAILPAALLALAPLPASLPLAAAAARNASSSSSSPSKGDSREPQKVAAASTPPPPPPPPSVGNHSGGGGGAQQRNPVLAMLRDLPALKAAVVGACAASVCLMACLLFRVLRCGGRKGREGPTLPANLSLLGPLKQLSPFPGPLTHPTPGAGEGEVKG
ncbi:membrane protein FAM174B-like, partial [Notechis scutatus]|uniref:Membrane protein FAM174B-like n=1 Tax=Notechis scutatus TaxID=8663 RepID=A0A6J1W4Q8_9SAUR